MDLFYTIDHAVELYLQFLSHDCAIRAAHMRVFIEGNSGEKEGLDRVSTKCSILTDTEYLLKHAFFKYCMKFTMTDSVDSRVPK